MLDAELEAEIAAQLKPVLGDIPFLFFSSVAQKGIVALKDKLWDMIHDHKARV